MSGRGRLQADLDRRWNRDGNVTTLTQHSMPCSNEELGRNLRTGRTIRKIARMCQQRTETHRNLCRKPKADERIRIILNVQNHHADTANRNQCAAFHKDDGHRCVWGATQELVRLLLRDTESNAYRDCNTQVHRCNERP